MYLNQHEILIYAPASHSFYLYSVTLLAEHINQGINVAHGR